MKAGSTHEILFLVITNSMEYFVTSLESNVLNQWYHLVGVFDGSNGVLLFIDGSDSDGTKTSLSTTATDDAGFEAHIGVRFPEKERHTNGYVDQFKFFYRMLTAVGKYFFCCFVHADVLQVKVVAFCKLILSQMYNFILLDFDWFYLFNCRNLERIYWVRH